MEKAYKFFGEAPEFSPEDAYRFVADLAVSGPFDSSRSTGDVSRVQTPALACYELSFDDAPRVKPTLKDAALESNLEDVCVLL